MPPAVEAWSPNHWAAREVPSVLFKGGDTEEKRHVRTGGRDERVTATSQGTPSIASKPPEAGRGKEDLSPESAEVLWTA